MAHGVKESFKPKVHQALHGYLDGHRQLAASVTLKPRDQKTLLALSDISGPGARLEEDGYLTGYPLPDSGFFALGRTWPAPEMPRPGCVWTHTLLIDFNDLAAWDSLSSLLTLFKRPTSSSGFQEYAKPKRIDIASYPILSHAAEAWAKPVMAAVYGKPKSRIVATRSTDDVDSAVLAIWSQQWPRLRRNFRFCTQAASDRSVEGASFDLQVLPSLDRSVRSRFSEVVDAEGFRSQHPWLESALKDLAYPDQSDLRSFFRRLGSDVAGGREAFRPLCLLHRALVAISQSSESAHEAITVLQEEVGLKQAKTARGIVAMAALETVEKLDDYSFDFLWDNLNLLEPDTLNASAAKLGQAAWHRDPKRLVELLNSDSAVNVVLDRSFVELEIRELIAGLKSVPQLIEVALARRPELVIEPDFWSYNNAVDASLETAKSRSLQSAVIAAMVKSGRSDLSRAAGHAFGARVLLQALNAIANFKGDHLLEWIQAIKNDTADIADFLSNQPCISRQTLQTLARTLPPDGVPNNYGADPWLIAWHNSTGSIGESDIFYLMAYFLSRALGARSRSQAELVQLSFEPIYDAVALDRLPDDSWHILEQRLPLSIFWFAWDRCQRLRTGVTDLFVERDLSPNCFARLTQNDQLFVMLASGVAQSWRGRAYLKRVRGSMTGEDDSVFDNRIHALDKLLD